MGELSLGFEPKLVTQPRSQAAYTSSSVTGTAHGKNPRLLFLPDFLELLSRTSHFIFIHIHLSAIQRKSSFCQLHCTFKWKKSISDIFNWSTGTSRQTQLYWKLNPEFPYRRALLQDPLLLTEERLIIYNYPDCSFLHCKMSSASFGIYFENNYGKKKRDFKSYK